LKPKFVKSFTKIIARIQTRTPICLEKYETSSKFGRFSLRDEGKTIAIGRIINYKPAKIVLQLQK
jgi:peptide chain release factor subunit 3